jgi:hypothetical protein
MYESRWGGLFIRERTSAFLTVFPYFFHGSAEELRQMFNISEELTPEEIAQQAQQQANFVPDPAVSADDGAAAAN